MLAKHLPAVLEIILLKQSDMSSGSRYTVATLTNYAIITIGVVLFFHSIGADWSKLQWLVAALGVGIGFGLQEIVANFICGIIILFERPVRVGDVVTVGDTDGTVTRIRIRATTITNYDKQELVVPNKEFITGRLVNWTLTDKMNRIVITIGVAYGSDVRRAMALLAEVAAENENVLYEPKPLISFEGFGDNALTLVLRCYLATLDNRLSTITALHTAINDKFAAAGIGIAGMFLDSALGAAVQGRFHCDRCDRASEWQRHRCGGTTRLLGGYRWLNNDGVNALSTAAATAAGWAAWAWHCSP